MENKELFDFSKDKSRKDGYCNQCKLCRKNYSNTYYVENKEDIINKVREYSNNNKEKISIKSSLYRLKNKEVIGKKNKIKRQINKEINKQRELSGLEAKVFTKKCYKCKQYKNSIEFNKDNTRLDGFSNLCKTCTAIRIAKWQKNNSKKCYQNSQTYRKNNPHKHCATQSKRRSIKLQRTPKWLTHIDYIAIEQFYIEAAKLTKETGIKHEVDHIIPLQGKTVSGLHVPNNLQILVKSENASKGNRF